MCTWYINVCVHGILRFLRNLSHGKAIMALKSHGLSPVKVPAAWTPTKEEFNNFNHVLYCYYNYYGGGCAHTHIRTHTYAHKHIHAYTHTHIHRLLRGTQHHPNGGATGVCVSLYVCTCGGMGVCCVCMCVCPLLSLTGIDMGACVWVYVDRCCCIFFTARTKRTGETPPQLWGRFTMTSKTAATVFVGPWRSHSSSCLKFYVRTLNKVNC